MAKRRNLEVPSGEALRQMEEEFRREAPGPRAGVAPIAQVAAESAAGFDPRSTTERAEAARDRLAAGELRAAQARGLVMLEIPLDEIDAEELVRDRVVIDAEELEELKAAIARNGLRLPIEVFVKAEGYGLLSGYRRLMAVRALRALNGDGRYDRIRAVLRDPEAMGGAFAAMVEENEIRAGLSQYERGRIAVIAAQQGAFANPEAAVEALFPVASKAKRSKIRSFALIFEELGDMLRFPDLIREKDGLRLAQALRDGAEVRLRAALGQGAEPDTPEAEAARIEAALAGLAPVAADLRRGGRPRRDRVAPVRVATGFTIEAQQDARGWSIRLGGDRPVDRELVERLVAELRYLLDRPD